jgi:hypothetical protein
MAFDRGYALLIGVGTYQNAPHLDVPITAADAEQIAMVLRDPQFCGYPADHVTLLRDTQATRAGILHELDSLATCATKDDTVVLFYSGHGHYGEDATYYLTTTDMQLTDKGKVADGSAIRQDELLARLQRLQAERVLLIFNACHSGQISPTLAGDEPAAFTGAPLPAPTTSALLSTGSGRVIITACRENQYAYVGDGEQTIFVQALAAGLRGEGLSSQRGFISAFDLYTGMYFAVTRAVQQTVPAAMRKRYSETQEPELTVLKGVGPFAVALYKGASATLGDFSAPEQPAAGTAVRQVEETESRAQFEKLIQITQNQSGGINFGVGNSIGQIGDVVAGDKIGGDKVAGDKIDARGSQGFINRATGPISQVFGPQRNISTGGGDYAEGNIDKRSGTFVGGDQYNLSGNISGSNVNIGSTLSNVSQSIGAMPHRDQTDMERLQQLLQQLNAALQQAPAAQQAEAEAVATFAKQLVDGASQPQPNKPIVQGLSMLLNQAAGQLAGTLPALAPIVAAMIAQIKRVAG